MASFSLLCRKLEQLGWDDAGRDCWAKYQGPEPSLVFRWIGGATAQQLLRARQEAQELVRAIDYALEMEPDECEQSP